MSGNANAGTTCVESNDLALLQQQAAREDKWYDRLAASQAKFTDLENALTAIADRLTAIETKLDLLVANIPGPAQGLTLVPGPVKEQP